MDMPTRLLAIKNKPYKNGVLELNHPYVLADITIINLYATVLAPRFLLNSENNTLRNGLDDFVGKNYLPSFWNAVFNHVFVVWVPKSILVENAHLRYQL